jgi:hypothetical protein
MYRTLTLSAWTLPQLRKLPYGTKALYVYCLLNKHSQLSGLYELPKAYIVDDTNWDVARIEAALRKLIEVDLIAYDEPYQVIWVKHMLELQGLHTLSIKLAPRIIRELKALEPCPLVAQARAAFVERQLLTNAKADTLSIPYRYPIDTPQGQGQGQGQSQGQGQGHGQGHGPGPDLSSRSIEPKDTTKEPQTPRAPDDAPVTTHPPKRKHTALRDQPGELSAKLADAIRAMETDAFHGLATPHKLNEKFWNTELDKVESERLTIYACLKDVDRYYVKHPKDWPRTEDSARRKMSAAIDTAIYRLLREARRTPTHAQRAAR